MKELSKDELLGYLEGWYCMSVPQYEEIDKQAYKQIRQLIENQPEVDEKFIEKWANRFERIQWNSGEFYVPLIQQLLREAGVKITLQSNKRKKKAG